MDTTTHPPLNMGAAAFRTHLDALALPADWIGKLIGVTEGRIWKYSRRERELAVPEPAARAVRDLMVQRESAVVACRDEVLAQGYVPRFIDPAKWWAWRPELDGWPAGAQGLFVAEVMARYQVDAVWV